jgi:hypothetical protein
MADLTDQELRRIERYQQSVFDDMPEGVGPADKEFVSVSKTGIPITKTQEIVQGNQKWGNDAWVAPFQAIGNKLWPGQPFGGANTFIMNEEQKKIQEARELESKAYLAKKEKVRDKLADIFDKIGKDQKTRTTIKKWHSRRVMKFFPLQD